MNQQKKHTSMTMKAMLPGLTPRTSQSDAYTCLAPVLAPGSKDAAPFKQHFKAYICVVRGYYMRIDYQKITFGRCSGLKRREWIGSPRFCAFPSTNGPNVSYFFASSLYPQKARRATGSGWMVFAATISGGKMRCAEILRRRLRRIDRT